MAPTALRKLLIYKVIGVACSENAVVAWKAHHDRLCNTLRLRRSSYASYHIDQQFPKRVLSLTGALDIAESNEPGL